MSFTSVRPTLVASSDMCSSLVLTHWSAFVVCGFAVAGRHVSAMGTGLSRPLGLCERWGGNGHSRKQKEWGMPLARAAQPSRESSARALLEARPAARMASYTGDSSLCGRS